MFFTPGCWNSCVHSKFCQVPSAWQKTRELVIIIAVLLCERLYRQQGWFLKSFCVFHVYFQSAIARIVFNAVILYFRSTKLVSCFRCLWNFDSCHLDGGLHIISWLKETRKFWNACLLNVDYNKKTVPWETNNIFAPQARHLTVTKPIRKV